VSGHQMNGLVFDTTILTKVVIISFHANRSFDKNRIKEHYNPSA